MLNFAKLEEKGLQVRFRNKWRGEPGIDRTSTPVEAQIESITLPLTAEDWCALCMREGRFYVGSCCGQTSYIQDYFNDIFRDGGRANSRTLLELQEMTMHHEGFELYNQKLTQSEVDEKLEHWNELDPIEKIGLCCATLRDQLYSTHNAPAEKYTPDPVSSLSGALRSLRWSDLYSNDLSTKREDLQRHANKQVLIARIIPECRAILAELPKSFVPFKGYAIVNEETEVQKNTFGLCLYGTKEEAQEIIDLWKKSEEANQEIAEDDRKSDQTRSFLKTLQIQPVEVTLEAGLNFIKI